MLRNNRNSKLECSLRVISDLIAEPIVVGDKKGNIIEVNEAFAKICNSNREELIGKSLEQLDCLSDKTKRILRRNLKKRLQGQNIEPFEIEVQAKNCSPKNFELLGKKIQYNGELVDIAILHDITQRKELERHLEKTADDKTLESATNEITLNTVFESSPDAITIFDLKGCIVKCNKATAVLHGFSIVQELIGKSAFELISPKDRDRIATIMKDLTETGSKKNLEYTSITNTGEEFSAEGSVATIRDPSGKLTGFVSITKNIQERKRTEKALEESEEKFRTISTSAMDAIILVDSADQIMYWNPAAEKVFGYTEKEVICHKLASLVIPLHGYESHSALLKELECGSIAKRHFEFSALRKDRSEFPIDLSLSSVKLKDKNLLLVIVKDISENKRMEIALKQERNMLESMAANIGAGLTIINRDYRILWANKLLEQIHGCNLENKVCYSIFDKSGRICPDCGVKKVFENGVNFDRHDYLYRDDKGHEDWVELIVTSVKDKDGKVVAALELAVNITERKLLQDKLASYSQKLEEMVDQRTEQLKQAQLKLVMSERLAAIGELAGMVGHDLRNPLTGIKNAAYYLRKKGSSITEVQAKDMLETIDKCVNHSNKIINDLLDYSREIHLELQELSPRSLLTEALAMVIVPKKVTILNQLSDLPYFRVDPDKLERVFINLVKNAIDAMPNGGKITIDGKEVNGTYEISFADTGTGIPEEILPKLFSPLFTTKAQGMGFGLAVCKRVVEAHHGTITVETANGKGTIFTLTFPKETKLEIGDEKDWINNPESLLSMTTKASEIL